MGTIVPRGVVGLWAAGCVQVAERPAVGESLRVVPEGEVCGVLDTAPDRLEHVIVIAMENKDTSQVAWSGAAPYFDSLLAQCGTSVAFLDNMFPSDLPSLPHYLALTSGSNCERGLGTRGSGCIDDNDGPDDHRLSSRSIFEQVGSWKAYQEDMPSPCDWGNPASGTDYYAKHNPAPYYSNLHDCWEHNIGIESIECSSSRNGGCSTPSNEFVDDLRNDTLAEYSFVTPDADNGMHDGSVSRGDNWMRTYLPLIFDSPAYGRGATAVYVVWDEQDDFDQGPQPVLFASPSVRNVVSDTPANLFAVLRAIEDQLGIDEHLGCAGGSPPGGGTCPRGSTVDLRAEFGL